MIAYCEQYAGLPEAYAPRVAGIQQLQGVMNGKGVYHACASGYEPERATLFSSKRRMGRAWIARALSRLR